MLGRPLVTLAVEQALRTGIFDVVAVSSDSDAILEAAAEAGPVLSIRRPGELATDGAGKVAAIRHALLTAENDLGTRFDVLADLDATAPLRTDDDIRQAVELLESSGAGTVFTASPARRSPWFNLVELDADGAPHLIREERGRFVCRQDTPPAYDLNSAVYAWQRDALLATDAVVRADTRVLIMPRDRSVDIDDEVDFMVVEALLQARVDDDVARG
jgi:N-acylneuraminate cytidylyltransferase/CMP-N,N'-diacetyllegionaminic acid synthase